MRHSSVNQKSLTHYRITIIIHTHKPTSFVESTMINDTHTHVCSNHDSISHLCSPFRFRRVSLLVVYWKKPYINWALSIAYNSCGQIRVTKRIRSSQSTAIATSPIHLQPTVRGNHCRPAPSGQRVAQLAYCQHKQCPQFIKNAQSTDMKVRQVKLNSHLHAYKPLSISLKHTHKHTQTFFFSQKETHKDQKITWKTRHIILSAHFAGRPLHRHPQSHIAINPTNITIEFII